MSESCSANRQKAILVVNAIFKTQNGILLLLRKNTSYASGCYGLVGGVVDENEAILQATIREVYEEVGVRVKETDLEFCCVLHKATQNYGYVNFYYVVRAWQGELQNAEPEKCEEIGFYAKEHLPQNTIPHVKQALDCLDRKVFFDQVC